ncbi:MAG: sterol desaturase family protein [Thiolinea sp.]
MLIDETLIRLGSFFTIISLMVALQIWLPRRNNPASLGEKTKRWSANFIMVFAATLLVRVLLPLSATAFALLVEERGWALLGFTMWVIPAIILLDMLIYFQHRIFHEVPLLWRLHKLHHSDNWLDVSSAVRFHPVEIFLSMLIKFAAILLFGVPALAIMWFEVILNGTALFNHSNARIPGDKWLRLFIVTPDMHRVHHSVYPEETNSNYGFNIPWWDRWFGTYTAQPRDGHKNMKIGINEFPQGETSLKNMLLMPFVKIKHGVASEKTG